MYLRFILPLLVTPTMIVQAEGVNTSLVEQAEKPTETIVITANRNAQDLAEISRTLAVINEQSLKLNNHTHIQQIFNQLPGVNFHRNSGQEYLAAIRSPVLTGAGACGEFLTLENGIPIRPAGMCNVNELFESHHQAAESIEIMRGAATVFYGSNGLHGVVNVITPRAPQGIGSTSLSFGSYGYTKLNQVNQFGDWTTSLTAIKDDGFRASSGYNQQLFTTKHQFNSDRYTVDSWVTIFNLDQDSAGFLQGKNVYKDKQLIKTNDNPEAYRKASGIRLYQKYQWQNGLTIAPFFRHSTMKFLQHFLPGQAVEENNQTSAGLQLQHAMTVDDNLSIEYGVDVELAAISLLEYQNNVTQGSEFLQATIPVGKHYDYSVQSQSIAPFVLLQAKLANGFTLNAGVRAEYISFDYDNQMLSGRTDELGNECGFGGCRFSRPGDRTDSFSQLSPQLGLNYQVNDYSRVYVSLVHGFRTPQTTELYRLQRQQSVADLKPVELQGFDGGWRYYKNDTQLLLSVFSYNKSNAILRNTDFYNVSGGKSKHQGIEFQIKQGISDAYSVGLNATYGKHTYRNNPNISEQDIIGLDADTAPRKLANAFVNYANGKLNWQLQAQYVGQYFTDIENEHRYPGHFLMHWKASYQWSSTMEIGLRVNNLTDKRYAQRADFTSFGGDRYFPGKPRNINVSFEFSY